MFELFLAKAVYYNDNLFIFTIKKCILFWPKKREAQYLETLNSNHFVHEAMSYFLRARFVAYDKRKGPLFCKVRWCCTK